jgi:hypothetical protein
MRPAQLETWVYDILDRVKAGQPIEDARIELKTGWPEAEKAARQIAGHANASPGEPILWVLGVNEKAKTVPGVDWNELADWTAQFRAQFDEGVFPDLRLNVNVPDGSVTVVALYFETARAPYLVKNPKGGHITTEVPWREGASTFSAHRSQLLRLLGPVVRLPGMEVLQAALVVRGNEQNRTDRRQGRLEWELNLDLYFMPVTPDLVVIPKWQTLAFFEIPGVRERTQFTILDYPHRHASPNINSSFDLQIKGTGVVSIMFHAYTNERLAGDTNERARIDLDIQPLDIERSILQSLSLAPVLRPMEGLLGSWLFQKNTNGVDLML